VHEHPVGSTMVDAFDPELFGEVVAPSWNLADMRDLARRRGFRWLVVHGSEEMYVLQPLERILADLEGAGLVARSAGPLSLVDLADPGPWPKAGYTMHDRPVPDPNSEAARTEVNIWEDCGIDLGG